MKNLSIYIWFLFLSLVGCRKDPVPIVFDKVDASSITETTAIFRILLKEINEAHYSEGVVYSKSPNPTIQDHHEGEFFSNPMDVTVGISGLEPGTLYHIRAFAETSSGFYYGDPFSITTLSPVWITDPRDGQRYLVRNYGSKIWMVQNLNFRTTNSKYYMDDSTKFAKDFGLLYLYDEAVDACPPGWKLPAKTDWDDLFKSCGQSEEKVYASILEPGTRLWQKNFEVKITNSNGFCIRPAGVFSLSDGIGKFSENGWVSVIWSKSENESGMNSFMFSTNSTKAFYNDIHHKEKNSPFYSLRCIKDN